MDGMFRFGRMDIQTSYQFTAKGFTPYKLRMSANLKRNILATLVFTLFLVIMRVDWKYVVLLGVVIFAVQYLKAARWDRYYITSLKMNDGNVEIEFYDKQEKRRLQGELKDFDFKQRTAFNRAFTPYLQVKFKETIIKQFEIVPDWNKHHFEEIKNAAIANRWKG
jgi:hypothetical protein